MAILVSMLNSENVGQANDVIGTNGADTINGGSESDTINGGAGNDLISGGLESDVLNGGADHDIVKGDAGNDCVRGDSGDDAVFGGGGDDRVYGGYGDDIIAGNAGKDILYGGRPNADASLSGSDCFIFDTKDGSDVVYGWDEGGIEDKVVLLDGGTYTLSYASDDTVLTYGDTVVRFKGATLTDDDIAVIDLSVGQIDLGASDFLNEGQMNLIIAADPFLL